MVGPYTELEYSLVGHRVSNTPVPATLDAPTASPAEIPTAALVAEGDTAPAGTDVARAEDDKQGMAVMEALLRGGEAQVLDVWLTIYLCPPYCGLMANGQQVYDGAAACGYGLALGQRFRIENDPTFRDYVCSDRGHGPRYWVDIFFRDAGAGWDFLTQVGTQARIVLLP